MLLEVTPLGHRGAAFGRSSLLLKSKLKQVGLLEVQSAAMATSTCREMASMRLSNTCCMLAIEDIMAPTMKVAMSALWGRGCRSSETVGVPLPRPAKGRGGTTMPRPAKGRGVAHGLGNWPGAAHDAPPPAGALGGSGGN